MIYGNGGVCVRGGVEMGECMKVSLGSIKGGDGGVGRKGVTSFCLAQTECLLTCVEIGYRVIRQGTTGRQIVIIIRAERNGNTIGFF